MPRRVASVTAGARIERSGRQAGKPVLPGCSVRLRRCPFGHRALGWYHEARDHRAARPNRDEGVFVCPSGRRGEGKQAGNSRQKSKCVKRLPLPTAYCPLSAARSGRRLVVTIQHVAIIDTTLREGEQFAQAHFTTAQKQTIACALDRFGVNAIEITNPAASPRSFADARLLAAMPRYRGHRRHRHAPSGRVTGAAAPPRVPRRD